MAVAGLLTTAAIAGVTWIIYSRHPPPDVACLSPPDRDLEMQYAKKIEEENRAPRRDLTRVIDYARQRVRASCDTIESRFALIEYLLEATDADGALAELRQIHDR